LPALRIGDKEKMIRCPLTEGRDENEMIKGQNQEVPDSSQAKEKTYFLF
jgi:hypothetical protein